MKPYVFRALVPVTFLGSAALMLLAGLAIGVQCHQPARRSDRFEAAAAAREAVLRVCGDPDKLPFSNARVQRREEELARNVARHRPAMLAYRRWTTRGAFGAETLGGDRCDAITGVPASVERLVATRP